MNTDNLLLLCISCFSLRHATNAPCPVCGYNESAQAESMYQLPPRTILAGKYMTGRALGEGGFGITYIGYDLNLQLKVAIKEYYPSGLVMRSATLSTTIYPMGGEQGELFAKGRERFVDEARRLARFRMLPGIVMVNDFFVENGTAYIVMEYIEGQTLKSYLTQVGGKLPAQQALDMMAPVFASLTQVHESGIIHRKGQKMAQIDYVQVGDYLLPNLILNEPPRELTEPITKYGAMRRSYLREHRISTYIILMKDK